MKNLMKMFTIVFLGGFMLVSCGKDADITTPPTDNTPDRPFPINPETEYAPERPTPDSPNPE